MQLLSTYLESPHLACYYSWKWIKSKGVKCYHPPVTIKQNQNFKKADNKAHFETPKYVSRTQLRIIKHKKKSIGPHTGSAIAAPFGGYGTFGLG